jgi:ribose 5-phosphate isomerase B
LSIFKSQNIDVEDLGAHDYNEQDDYPDYVIPVMREMENDPEAKAILICRNGVGVSILANKFNGIRCTLSWKVSHAKSSRVDDDTNVLALPADYVDPEVAEEIVKVWLDTPFSEKDRHKRRLKKVEEAV